MAPISIGRNRSHRLKFFFPKFSRRRKFSHRKKIFAPTNDERTSERTNKKKFSVALPVDEIQLTATNYTSPNVGWMKAKSASTRPPVHASTCRGVDASRRRRLDVLTRRRVEASTRRGVDSSTRPRVDASTRRRADAPTRRRVEICFSPHVALLRGTWLPFALVPDFFCTPSQS